MKFNTGLCKWVQYVNALSDATGCDPGSVIAMAGQLGYKACGIDLWGTGGEGRLAPRLRVQGQLQPEHRRHRR
eukprot:7378255-Prymnesium_polylepis.3